METRSGDELDAVESRYYVRDNFPLECGKVLAELRIAYETYGTLAADRRNVVLLTHGFTSHHHMAGRYREGSAPPGLEADTTGTWSRLVGPGLAIDTNRWFVVSSNTLGSSWGSTGPRDVDRRTAQRYGPNFPRLTLNDMVHAQRCLLDALGVDHLVAVIGPSYGGYLAFQWAVQYPGSMRGVAPVFSAPRAPDARAATEKLLAELAADPRWNDGWYYEGAGPESTLLAHRTRLLKRYGIDALLTATIPEPAARQVAIEESARRWARVFDANSMVTLRRALEGFDVEPLFHRITAKVFYVLSRTDEVFPPHLAQSVMAKLAESAVDATYFEVDSAAGHLASAHDADRWAPALAKFLGRLDV